MRVIIDSMERPSLERIIKVISIIVPVSTAYVITLPKIADVTSSINFESNVGFVLAMCLLAIIGFAMFHYRYILSLIKSRLSPANIRDSLCYTILASLPFLSAVIFTETFKWQNCIVVTLLAILALAILVIGSLYKTNSPNKPAPGRVLFLKDKDDEEIKFTKGQKVASETIKSLLADSGNYPEVGPLSIAVNGRWGDGKTTIVDSVINDLEKDKFIVVRFDPWRYTSQESLVSGFYDEIGVAIAQELPGFRTARVDFAKFARNFISALTKSESLLSAIQFSEPSTRHYPQKIDKHLSQNNKKLLVIIDDIERLYEDEHITRTLQLAQYLKGDIENSVIIFLTDMQQIESAIPTRLNGASYLQKFFDTTVVISPPTEKEMLNFMNLYLSRLDLDIDVQLKEDVRLSRLMRNVRGVKRVLSMFSNDISAVSDNVNAQDVLFLRTLYYAHPGLYIDLRENTSMYFGYSYSFSDPEFGTFGFNEEGFEATQVEHFNSLFSEMKFSKQDTQRLKSLLEDYLPALKNVFRDPGTGKMYVDRGLSKDRRIGSREYLERYFIYSEEVDKKHLVEKQIDEFIDKYWDKTDTVRYEKLVKLYSEFAKDSKKVFVELYLEKIQDVNVGDKDDSSAIRKKHYRDILRVNLSTTDYIQVDGDGTLMRTLGAIDQNLISSDFPYIFKDLVKFMNHPTVSLRVALYMNPQRDNGLHYLRQYSGYSELREQILKTVDTYYLKHGHNILKEDATAEKDWIFVAAQWSTSVCYNNLEELDQARFNKVNKYLLRIVKEDTSLLQKLILGAFWSTDLVRNKKRFFFNNKPKAYDNELFIKESKRQLKNMSNSMSKSENATLKDFINAYERFISEQLASEPDN